jgi:hypothetical protein
MLTWSPLRPAAAAQCPGAVQRVNVCQGQRSVRTVTRRSATDSGDDGSVLALEAVHTPRRSGPGMMQHGPGARHCAAQQSKAQRRRSTLCSTAPHSAIVAGDKLQVEGMSAETTIMGKAQGVQHGTVVAT